MRTIIDPLEIEQEELESVEVSNQATISFSKFRILDNKMNVRIKALSLTNSSFFSPAQDDEKDLGKNNYNKRSFLSNNKFKNV